MLVKTFKYFFLPLLVCLCGITARLYAQSDSLKIYDMDLNQLSKLKINSVSKVVQAITEVPSTICIITAAEIRERGYFTLEEALSDLPGFQFRNPLGQNSYVFQRGIPNQNNLILLLIDGVQVNELNSGGFYGGGQYNLAHVERIEVIYGPASVAYGTNAVSGIINIITGNPMEKQAGMNGLVGNFGTLACDMGFSRVNKAKTAGIRFSGMFRMSDKADLIGAAGDSNWTDMMDNDERDYAFGIRARFKDFTVGVDYLNKQTSTVTNNKAIGTIYKDYGTLWNILFVNDYIKYQKRFNNRLSFASTLYNRNTTVLGNSVYNVVDTAQVGYYRPNNLTGIEGVLNTDFSQTFSLTGGVVFEWERLSRQPSLSYSDSCNQKPPRPGSPDMVNNLLASAFVEPRITLFKNLYISGGVRFDHSSVYQQVLTPRVGLSYHLRKHVFRFSYAEAYRAPKPWDYTDGIGNSGLLPEKMRSLETSFTFLIKDKFSIDMAGYRNNLSNAFTKYTYSMGYFWINHQSIKTWGAEIFLRFVAGNFKTFLNYTFNNSRDALGNLIPEISEHSANAGVTYSFLKYFRINLRANYLGKRKNPVMISATGSQWVDPAIILNGALSCLNYKGLTVQLIVKNMLNTEYYHTSNRDPAPERYRQPQRTVMFSVGYTLNE